MKHLLLTTRLQRSDDFTSLNTLVPFNAATGSKDVFVRREAILNRAEKVAGYEFSMLTKSLAGICRSGRVTRRPYDEVLLDRLGLYGVSSLIDHRLALINLSSDSLNNPLIGQLLPQNTLLMLDATEHAQALEDVLERVAELKNRGFSFGARTINSACLRKLFVSYMDFIQVDVPAFNGLDLRTLTHESKNARPEGRAQPRLIAHDVQSHDEFQFCRKCGFDHKKP